MNKIFVLSEENTKSLLEMEEVIETVENVYKEKSLGSGKVFPLVFHEFERAVADMDIKLSASSRIEQLTPINFEHFRSQTCSDDVSFGS